MADEGLDHLEEVEGVERGGGEHGGELEALGVQRGGHRLDAACVERRVERVVAEELAWRGGEEG